MNELFAGGVARDVGRGDGAILHCESKGHGIAIIAPLGFGMSVEGLKEASGQRGFYEAIGACDQLVLYDQSDPEPGLEPDQAWEQRGANLWSVADACGIERAVLYGEFDAGYTVARAARQRPERVLGVIFNAVPVSMLDSSAAQCLCGQPDLPILERTKLVLQALGVEAREATLLAAAWESEHRSGLDAVLSLTLGAELRSMSDAPSRRVLIIEPQSAPMAAAFGWEPAKLLGVARLVRPVRSGETIGAIHSFLAQIDVEEGRQASRLTADQSAAVGATEHSVAGLRRILVPVGDDLSSERAASMACRLGEPQHAEIVLLHVAEIPLTRPLQELEPEERKRADRALRLGEAIVSNHGLHCRTRLLVERSASTGILRAAGEEQADLIVMAMGEKRPGMASEMSSTMQKVLRSAPCEVLIDQAQGVPL
jgi:nucleotide-binding universal stress UspA family protein